MGEKKRRITELEWALSESMHENAQLKLRLELAVRNLTKAIGTITKLREETHENRNRKTDFKAGENQ